MTQRQGLMATALLSSLLVGCAGMSASDQAPPPPSADALPSNGVMILQCGGTPVRVTLHNEEALIEAVHGQYILKRVASASGARYVDPQDSTTSFWNKDDKGMLTIKGDTFPECEPAGALVLIVMCANLVGDGLRDALDPGIRPARRRRWREHRYDFLYANS